MPQGSLKEYLASKRAMGAGNRMDTTVVAPSAKSRYGVVGEQQLDSGYYTGHSRDGRVRPMEPTEDRIDMNGEKYGVDQGEVLVNDAQTVQDFGGPEGLDKAIQNGRRMMKGGIPTKRRYMGGGSPAVAPSGRMPARSNVISFSGMSRRRYVDGGSPTSDMSKYWKMDYSPTGSSYSQMSNTDLGAWDPQKQGGLYTQGEGGAYNKTKDLGSLMSDINATKGLNSTGWTPSTTAAASIRDRLPKGGVDSSEMYAGKGPVQLTDEQKEQMRISIGAKPGSDVSALSTEQINDLKRGKTLDEVGGIPEPEVVRQRGIEAYTPSDREDATMKYYVGRMAAMNESERAAEAQRMLQEGMDPAQIEKMIAISDVARREGMSSAMAQMGLGAMETAEQRAIRAGEDVKWEKTFNEEKAKYGDTQEWKAFETALDMGSDQDIIDAYFKATGETLDPASVAEYRGYYRTKRSQDIEATGLTIDEMRDSMEDNDFNSFMDQVNSGGTYEAIKGMMGDRFPDITEEEFKTFQETYALTTAGTRLKLGNDSFNAIVDGITAGDSFEALSKRFPDLTKEQYDNIVTEGYRGERDYGRKMQMGQIALGAALKSGDYDTVGTIMSELGIASGTSFGDIDFSKLENEDNANLFANSMADLATLSKTVNDWTDPAAKVSLGNAWKSLGKPGPNEEGFNENEFKTWAENTYDNILLHNDPIYSSVNAITDTTLTGLLSTTVGLLDNGNIDPNWDIEKDFDFKGVKGIAGARLALTNLFATGGMAFDSNGNMVPDLDNPGWQALGYKGAGGGEGEGVVNETFGDTSEGKNLAIGSSVVVDGITYTRTKAGTGKDSFTTKAAIELTGAFAGENFVNAAVGDVVTRENDTYVRTGTGSGNSDFVKVTGGSFDGGTSRLGGNEVAILDEATGKWKTPAVGEIVSFSGANMPAPEFGYGSIPAGAYKVVSVPVEITDQQGNKQTKYANVLQSVTDPSQQYLADKTVGGPEGVLWSSTASLYGGLDKLGIKR